MASQCVAKIKLIAFRGESMVLYRGTFTTPFKQNAQGLATLSVPNSRIGGNPMASCNYSIHCTTDLSNPNPSSDLFERSFCVKAVL